MCKNTCDRCDEPLHVEGKYKIDNSNKEYQICVTNLSCVKCGREVELIEKIDYETTHTIESTIKFFGGDKFYIDLPDLLKKIAEKTDDENIQTDIKIAIKYLSEIAERGKEIYDQELLFYLYNTGILKDKLKHLNDLCDCEIIE